MFQKQIPKIISFTNMAIIDFVKNAFKNTERFSLRFIWIVLFLKGFIDNPVFTKYIEKNETLTFFFGKQTIDETLLTFVLSAIAYGVSSILNNQELFEENFFTELKSIGVKMPQVNRFSKQNGNYNSISKKILNEQSQIIEQLSDGIFSVQLELMEKMQEVIMHTFNDRMDAVSNNDLKLWSNIYKEKNSNDEALISKEIENSGDLGIKYYYRIRSLKKFHNTVLTRIFVIERNGLDDKDKEALARILAQHIDDRIGVAVTYLENLHPTFLKWLGNGDLKNSPKPRLDFAIFDQNKAITFFRKYISNERFEAIVDLEKWKDLILGQREVHKTLVTASILGTQQFFESIFWTTKLETTKRNTPYKKSTLSFYNRNDRKQIEDVIKHLRREAQKNIGEGASENKDEQIQSFFSTYITKKEYDESSDKISYLKGKIEDSIKTSKKLETNVYRFSFLVKQLEKRRQF